MNDKTRRMPSWLPFVLVSLIMLAIFPPFVIFYLETSVYVIENPTQEQVLQLIEGDPDNLVWFEDAAQLYQGSSLIKVELKTRTFDDWRIDKFLDEVGVEYQLVKK